MEDKHDHNYAPSNGFLMGVVVGGIVTLLFTTKKGREIVKDLTDKGLEKLNDFEKSIEATKEEYEEIIDGDDYIEPIESSNLQLKSEAKNEKKSPILNKPKREVKRFFRLKKNS
ncbi:MAG TPA: YtxH domain-containing protein [Candidatus Saccharimonadales bacterium]|nr:YtxH domain-containing protein [Candidatus Saccharimonadales bacterium]